MQAENSGGVWRRRQATGRIAEQTTVTLLWLSHFLCLVTVIFSNCMLWLAVSSAGIKQASQLLLKAGSGWGLTLLFVLFTFLSGRKFILKISCSTCIFRSTRWSLRNQKKSLPKRVFKHGRMQSNTPANGLAHDLFSKCYVLINRVLGHGGPEAGNYCRGFCVFFFSDTDAIGQPSSEFFTEG